MDARAAHEARTRERRVVDDTSYSQTEQTPNDWTVWYPPETRERPVYDTNAVPKQKSQADLRADERSRHEQLGIVQRQNQAEAEARAARASVLYSRPPPVITRTPSTVEDGSSDLENLPILPLESPKRYDGDSSTDAESADENTMYRRLARMHMRDSQDLSPSKPTFGMYVGFISVFFVSKDLFINNTASLLLLLQRPHLPLHLSKPSTILSLCLNINVRKVMRHLYNPCSRNPPSMRHHLLFFSDTRDLPLCIQT